LKDIKAVYHQYKFPEKFGKYMFLSGMAYFVIVSFDHLINNQAVFTRDVFVVPAAFFATGYITISLSEKKCRVGERWKLKVLGIRIR
jgi:formate/nitrite transporter FocA (FNT family)